jgi:hypothetical protein
MCDNLCEYILAQFITILNDLPTTNAENPIVQADIEITWTLPKRMVTLDKVALGGNFRPNSALQWAIVNNGPSCEIIERFA